MMSELNGGIYSRFIQNELVVCHESCRHIVSKSQRFTIIQVGRRWTL